MTEEKPKEATMEGEIQLTDLKPSQDEKVDATGEKSGKKSLSRFTESDKAAALYIYDAVPNFYEDCISIEQ